MGKNRIHLLECINTNNMYVHTTSLPRSALHCFAMICIALHCFALLRFAFKPHNALLFFAFLWIASHCFISCSKHLQYSTVFPLPWLRFHCHTCLRIALHCLNEIYSSLHCFALVRLASVSICLHWFALLHTALLHIALLSITLLHITLDYLCTCSDCLHCLGQLCITLHWKTLLCMAFLAYLPIA